MADDAVVATPLPADPVRADVVVVGLGASGLEAIVLLAEAGLDVVGLDANGIAGGAAGANGGFLLAGLPDFHHEAVGRHGRPAANSWWHRTVEELDRLEEDEPSFQRVGSLRIGADEDEERDCLIHLAQMKRDGIDALAYDGPEGRGLLVPGDGMFHPGQRCQRLASRALDAGARLHAPAPVQSVDTGRTRVASPDGGTREVRSRVVLVAVDGGLEHVVPEVASTVRTARLQMLATAPLPPPTVPRPVYRRFGLDWFQQRRTGEVLLGGGRDVGGDEEWDAPAEPSEAVQSHLDRLLGELGLDWAAVTHRWAARAAFTTTRLPIDAQPRPRVHVVGGYSGHGNVIGSLLARQAARRILASTQ